MQTVGAARPGVPAADRPTGAGREGQAAAGAPGRRVAFGTLTWMHFVNDGLAAFLPGVLPFLATRRGVPLAWAGGLMTALLIGQVLQPLAGAWADRLGGRRLIVWGPMLGAVGTVALAFVPSIPLVAASLFLIGIGSTLFHPQALAAARNLSGRREGTLMSAFLVGGELGRALGPLAAGLLAVHLGLSRLWLLALPLALTWPWIWRRLPRLPVRRGPVAHIAWRRHGRRMGALVAFGTLRATAMYGITTLVPLFWHARGGSLVTGAALVTTLVGVGIAGNLTGGLVADRWGRWPVLAGSSLLSAALLVLFAHVHGFWMWPTLAATGIALFSTLPVTTLVGQDIFAENPALGSGVALGLANGLGAVLLLPLSLAAAAWGIGAGFWIIVGLMVCALPFVSAMGVGRLREPRADTAG